MHTGALEKVAKQIWCHMVNYPTSFFVLVPCIDSYCLE